MSVSEHVKEVTRKNPFGDEFYNVPSNEMLFKKPLLCCEMKTRNGSFLEKTARDQAWIPGPKYDVMQNWEKAIPGPKGKWFKGKRRTMTEEQMILGSKKERSNPGPAAYKHDENWEKTSKARRVIGNF